MKAYDENAKYILFINKSITILGCSIVNSLTIGFSGHISQHFFASASPLRFVKLPRPGIPTSAHKVSTPSDSSSILSWPTSAPAENHHEPRTVFSPSNREKMRCFDTLWPDSTRPHLRSGTSTKTWLSRL